MNITDQAIEAIAALEEDDSDDPADPRLDDTLPLDIQAQTEDETEETRPNNITPAEPEATTAAVPKPTKEVVVVVRPSPSGTLRATTGGTGCGNPPDLTKTNSHGPGPLGVIVDLDLDYFEPSQSQPQQETPMSTSSRVSFYDYVLVLVLVSRKLKLYIEPFNQISF